MPSRVLAFPFIILGILVITLILREGIGYYYLIPIAVILVVIYVLHPQIDWWWFRRYPPRLESEGRALLERFFPYYQQLDPERRRRFESRAYLIRMSKDFKTQAEEDMPDDVKLIFAANQAQLTIGLENYLLENFEKVIVYPGDFPSPKYPEHFHISEVFEEEVSNGFIFSIQYLMAAFMQPGQYYNITMHELVHALYLEHPNWPWPSVDERIWPTLETISGFPTSKLLKTIGRPDVEPLPALVTHFMVFPDKFKTVLPEQYAQLNQLLKTY